MNTLVSQWLTGRATLAGMLGGGVGEPGGGWFCQSVDKTNCPPEKLENIIRQIGTVNQLLAADGLSPHSHTWVFAQGKIRSVTRPDGWTLVVVTRADAAATRTLNVLASEFLALEPAG